MAKKAGVITINLAAGTATFIRDMEAAKAKVRDFGTDIERTKAKVSGGFNMRFAMLGAKDLMEGRTMNAVAELVNELTTLKGIQFAGAALGIAAIGYAAYEVNKHLREMSEMPQKIGGAFREIQAPLRLTNDELRVTNDRLENDIAKLEGHRQNTLKLALDEARVAADKLADSLDEDLSKLHNLLKEHGVGFMDQIIDFQAGTRDLTKEIGGETGFGKFRGKVDDIADQGNAKIRAATDLKQKDAAQTELNTNLLKAYGDELARINGLLADAEALQKKRDPRPQPMIPGVIAPTEIGSEIILDQSGRIERLKRLRRVLESQVDKIGLRGTNTDLTEKKESLEAKNANTELDRPFAERMKAMEAELEAVRQKLSAVGETESGRILAEAYGEALKAITEVNKALEHKHAPPLASAQEDQILNTQLKIDTAKAEEQFQSKLVQTDRTIQERIRSTEMLTEAIGKGYEATRRAAVETQVAQTIGPERFSDPDFMAKHSGDVQTVRRSVETEFDAKHAEQVARAIDQLDDQIILEKSLAAAQEKGAEAVRVQTLAYRLRDLSAKGATEEQLTREVDLFQAQKANRNAEELAKANQEIVASARIVEAQPRGAEAVRKAQLTTKYEQMERGGASTEEIRATRTVDDLHRQEEITSEALKQSLAFRNQLESINLQIERLEQLRTTEGSTLDIEIDLKRLRTEQIYVLSEQLLAIGSARDGIRAFFMEMGADAESAARKIHDLLSRSFDSLNDTLARALSGQQVSWHQFFQNLSADMNKMLLQKIETTIAAKIYGGIDVVGKRAPMDEKLPDGSTPAEQITKRGGIAGKLADIFGVGKTVTKRDGSTQATALYVQQAASGDDPVAQALAKSDAREASKPDGRPGNPIHVWVDNSQPANGESGSSAGVAGGLAGFLAGLLGGGGEGSSVVSDSLSEVVSSAISYGGAFADGGPVKANMAHLVGEKGPEIFVPKTAGTIIPNHKLGLFSGPDKHRLSTGAQGIADMPFGGFREMGGLVSPGSAYEVGEGGPEMFIEASGRIADMSGSRRGRAPALVHHEYSIDARGADPALVERRVVSAIRAAHSDAIMTGQKVSIERSKRTPTR